MSQKAAARPVIRLRNNFAGISTSKNQPLHKKSNPIISRITNQSAYMSPSVQIKHRSLKVTDILTEFVAFFYGFVSGFQKNYYRGYQKIRYSYLLARIYAALKFGVFVNGKIDIKPAGKKGLGIFSATGVKKGGLAFIATGPVHIAHFGGNACYDYPNWYGIDKDTWIDIQDPYMRINHSCKPNLGIDNGRFFVALEDIKVGDELTFDYAISDDELDWELDCYCETELCNGKIGPVQNMSPERYRHSHPFIPKYFQKVYNEHQCSH